MRLDATEDYDIPIRNVSSETMPAFAIARVAGYAEESNIDVTQAAKPTGNGSLFVINGPLSLAPGAAGLASRSYGVRVLYNPLDTPQTGAKWGPKTDWRIHASEDGVRIVGAHDGTTVRAAFVGAGGSGDTLTPFELSENLDGQNSTAALAWPLLSNGTADKSDPQARFYVINDADSTYWGLSEYTGVTDETEHGYRGEAVFVTEDYNSTGIPGYEIVTMDGPVPLLQVKIPASFSYDKDAADYEIETTFGLGESWAAGRPAEAADSGSSLIDCRDPDELAKTASEGAKFIAAWERQQEKYRLIANRAPGESRLARTGISGITAADYDEPSDTLTYGQGEATLFIDNDDGTATRDSQNPVTLYNSVPDETIDGNTIVQCKTIHGKLFVDVEPC